MRSRAAREAGFTLVEILLAMSLMLLLLTATLATFSKFEAGEASTQKINAELETARNALDIAARQERNMGRPDSSAATNTVQPSIFRAAADDLIFLTSDPTRQWVRYCVQRSGTYGTQTATSDSAVLWELNTANTGTLSASMYAACPGTGWTNGGTRVVAEHLSNYSLSRDRPVFTYLCSDGTACGDAKKINQISTSVYLDLNPNLAPPEERTTSTVFLRNQNEAPVALFTATPGSRGTLNLNASASTDPEGRTLTYYWFKDSIPAAFNCQSGPPAGTTYLQGVTATFSGTSGSAPNLFLVVCDPGFLSASSNPAPTTIP